MNYLRSGFLSDEDTRAPSEVPTEIGQGISDYVETEAPSSGVWSFGGLFKCLGKMSGEMLEAYKQDLSEFADGLKIESEIVAGVTVHVVKDFPHTLETSAVVAQESFDSVGQSLEEFGGSLWRGTSELIASVKEAVQKVDEEAVSSSKAKARLSRELPATHTSWQYSRYKAQVNAMQRESSTYCDEPEDGKEYNSWRLTFNLCEKKADIEALLKENALMQELEARIVPLIVEYDSFWTRYFYRLHRLQQADDARADLVKRATSSAEEELSWDVEEDVEEIRHDANGTQGVPRIKAVNKAVPNDTDNENAFRTHAESSEASSPTGGRRSEQGINTTEIHGRGHDEESASEGSTGSDWLVVQEHNHGVVDTYVSTALTQNKCEEKLSAVLSDTHTVVAKVPELERVGDLIVSNTRKEEPEKSSMKITADAKSIAEEPEDWGDWE